MTEPKSPKNRPMVQISSTGEEIPDFEQRGGAQNSERGTHNNDADQLNGTGAIQFKNIQAKLQTLIEGQNRLEQQISDVHLLLETIGRGHNNDESAVSYQFSTSNEHRAISQRTMGRVPSNRDGQPDRDSRLTIDAQRSMMSQAQSGGTPAQEGSQMSLRHVLSGAPSQEIRNVRTISDHTSQTRRAFATTSGKSVVIGDLRKNDLDHSVSDESDDATQTLPSDWPACLEMHSSLLGDTDRSAVASCKSYLLNASRTLTAGDGNITNHVQKVKMNMRFILSPTSKPRVMFDCITALATVYDLLTTPFYLAWDLETTGTAKTLTYITASYWTFDMFISARTGFFRNGDLVLEPGAVLAHYLKTWFFPDLLLVITDWMVMFMAEDAQGLSLLRMYKIVKLARLFRLARLIQVLKRFMDRSTSDLVDTYLQIFQVVFSTLWSTHVLACAWFAIGRLAPQGTGESWLNLSIANDGPLSFQDAEHIYQYASAFHWGMQMMTMGAMDVIPTNSTERFFSACCLVFGLVFFSSMISMFNAKLMQIIVQRQNHSNQISLVRQVLGRFTLPQQLTVMVQQQIVKRMNNKRTLTTNDVDAFKFLPLSLTMALQAEMCAPYLHTLAYFWLWARLDKTGHQKLCHSAAEFHVWTAGDSVFMAGSTQKGVYISVRGTLTYRLELLPSIRQGNRVREVPPLTCMCEAALWCRWMTVGKAEAKRECEGIIINVERFLECVLTNRLMKNVAQEYGIAFTSRLVSATDDREFPDDLKIPRSEAIDIIMNTSREIQVLFGLAAFEFYRGSWSHFPLLPDTYLQLRSEIEEGQCALTLDERGEVVRGVAIAVLHLENDREEIFARIGQWDGNQVSCACELPGTKCQIDEDAKEAAMRMLQEDLPEFSEKIEFLDEDSDERDEESSFSKKYRMRTKYVRISIRAKVLETESLSFLQERQLELAFGAKSVRVAKTKSERLSRHSERHSRKASRISGKELDDFENRDVFMLKSAKGKEYVYTWMDKDDFHKFQKGARRQSAIANFLDKFHYARNSSRGSSHTTDSKHTADSNSIVDVGGRLEGNRSTVRSVGRSTLSSCAVGSVPASREGERSSVSSDIVGGGVENSVGSVVLL